MKIFVCAALIVFFVSVKFGQIKQTGATSTLPVSEAKKSNTESAIYIPADRRHHGLSRFDLIPFTDRKKGDPDRYRAVNPKYVKRENGRYFFALTVKKDTHYFD